jgi:propanol-preferring alcohol dehydrogenase
MATMRVAELPGIGEALRIAHREIPVPGPGDVLVQVQACGVCGSDLFLQDGGFLLQRDGTFSAEGFPIVPGHEAAGVVHTLGEGVEDLTVGQQVAIYYIDPRAGTSWSSSGRPQLDPGIQRMGVDVDGAFAEYVVRPARTLIPSPVPMNPASLAVLTDAVATPFHALTTRGHLSAGETLLVLGVGGLGSNAVQIGKLLGARVIAVSRSDRGLDLAMSLGADHVVRSGPDVAREVAALCANGEPEVVIQCAGSPQADELAIQLAGRGGRILLVAVARAAFSALSADLIWRELSVLACCRFTPEEIKTVIQLHVDGKLRTDHLITQLRPLEEANEALADLRSGRVLRTVLVP